MKRPSDQTTITATMLEHFGVNCERIGREVPYCEGHNCAGCLLVMRMREECLPPRTLPEVAARLHLPLATCERVLEDGVRRGWLSVSKSIESAAQVEDLLGQELEKLMGAAGRQLLAQAQAMTQRKPATSVQVYLSELLIALELNVAASFADTDLQPLLRRFHSQISAV